MSSVAAARLVAHRSPAFRCRQLLLGPPLPRWNLRGVRESGRILAVPTFAHHPAVP